MILCHCVVVTSTSVADVVRTGVRSLGEVCRTTGAGAGCGACVLGVKQVLGELLGPIDESSVSDVDVGVLPPMRRVEATSCQGAA